MRFLLLDDEKSALLSMKFRLSRFRIEAATFEDDSVAFAAFSEAPSTFDAVIAKLAMRRTRGDSFAKRIWAIAPEMPITVLTGLSEQERFEDARVESGVCALTNPASIADVLASLESQGLRLPYSASVAGSVAGSGTGAVAGTTAEGTSPSRFRSQ